jgi:hypothetical protein
MPVRRLALAAALMLAASPIRADDAGPAPVPASVPSSVPVEALLAAIGAWVAVELGLEAAPEPPAIRRDSPERLASRRGWGARLAGRPGHVGVLALYDASAGRIHLRSDWTGRDVYEVSVLVHEMVHHAQHVTGRRFACPGSAEAEAYTLQARWLGLFGADLAALGVDPLFVRLLRACGF